MDPFLMGLLFGAGYLTGLLGVQQIGLYFHDRGNPERAVGWFRLATQLALNPRLRVILRGNLMAALHCSGNYAAVDREWLHVRDRLNAAGAFAPLLQACYAASLFYQGRYNEGLEVTVFKDQPGRRQVGVEDCEMLLFINRGACFFELGRFEEAHLCLEEASERNSRQKVVSTALSLARARHALQADNYPEVLRILRNQEFQELPPVYSGDVELHRAQIFARCNALEEAEGILARPPRYESPRGRFLRPLAQAYLWQGRGESRRALIEFQRALDTRYPAGEPGLHAGDLAQAMGDLPAARDFYMHSIGSDRESIWALQAAHRLKHLQ